jgi:sporulation protein YlmC with PRC-barrel domain
MNSTNGMQSTGSPQFIDKQNSDQWLASNFKGTDVVGTQDEKIGDVNDVLFDRDGKVVAYVVGVGGFLGIGSKEVALSPSSFQFIPGQSDNDYKLRLSMSKDQLKNAVAFEDNSSRATTTGMGTTAPRPTTTAPSPMTPAPATNPPK